MLFQAEVLEAFTQRILQALGTPEDAARLVAHSLVKANLRGVDSHGLLLVPVYVQQLEIPSVDPKAEGRVIHENGPCLVYDGQNGLGQVVADRSCDQVIRLAKNYGMGMVVARESNHFGSAGYWARKITRAGLLGIVMTNASPAVPPFQGKEPRFGTSPICVAVPSTGEGAWMLDMATTTVSMGKLYSAFWRGETTIPAGWATDKDGVPTTDTETAINGLMSPLGGYKGSGLAMLVEILCSVLSGGPMSGEVHSLRWSREPLRISHMFLAVDISRFLPPEEFQQRMQWLVPHVKSAAPAAGYSEVLVADEPELRMEAQRRVEGIPISESLWSDLCAIARRVGVEPPEVGQAVGAKEEGGAANVP
ncbi:MAG: Ldh family oxidoreductase [Bryobacteraceae bacterium]